MPFDNLKRLINTQETTVCFIDDAGQAPPAVQAALMQLVEARQVDGHKISDKVVFIMATNRKTDKAAVSGMLEPLKGRSIMLNLEVTKDDWVQWALTHGMPAPLVAFINMRPDFLTEFKPTTEMTNSPTPRTIARVGVHQNAGLPAELEYPVFAGCAGEGFASEYIGFLKIYRSLPDIDDILRRPDTALVPGNNEPATLYAVAGALAAAATQENFASVITYANRMPTEFSTLLVSDAIRRTPELTSTKAFISWGEKHAEYIF